MEFKKITITDFLSYFDKNEINFSGTTTVFIGKNNSGKSKLFDAFNWCLYNRVWDKSRNNGKGGWISEDDSITELASYILNNTAKFCHFLNKKIAFHNFFWYYGTREPLNKSSAAEQRIFCSDSAV